MFQHSAPRASALCLSLVQKKCSDSINELTATDKKKKFRLTHEIKLPEHREDKIFSFLEKGTIKKTEKQLARKCDLFSYPKEPLLSSSWINGLADIVITCYMGDIHSNPL